MSRKASSKIPMKSIRRSTKKSKNDGVMKAAGQMSLCVPAAFPRGGILRDGEPCTLDQ
jgi:hypothetical protein